MEQMTSSKLNVVEKGLYTKCIQKNPGITEDDFMKARTAFLSMSNADAKKFFQIGNILMEDKPDTDTVEEVKDQARTS